MRKIFKAATVAAIAVGAASAPLIAGATTTPSAPAKVQACVKYGPKGGKDATGNFILFNWNRATCPSGTYAESWDSQGAQQGAAGAAGAKGDTGAQGPSGVVATATDDLGGVASVPTGGGFVSNATLVGTVNLAAGTYLVSVSAKATPLAATGAVQVFPQFFVYDQAANSSFTGDLLNVGSGALESGANATIDSYYSGSSTVTLDAATTLHIYAFGYDSDQGASNYKLDDLTVNATAITPAS